MILFCDGRDPRVYLTFYFINWAYKVRICWQSNQLMNTCDPYQLSTLSYDVYDAPKKSSRLQVSQFVRPFCNNYFFFFEKNQVFLSQFSSCASIISKYPKWKYPNFELFLLCLHFQKRIVIIITHFFFLWVCPSVIWITDSSTVEVKENILMHDFVKC